MNNKMLTNWGFGCAIQIVTAILLMIVLPDIAPMAIAYAFLLGIPALILRFVFHKGGYGSPIFHRMLGPAFFAVSLLLAFLVPLERHPTDKTEIEPSSSSIQTFDSPKNDSSKEGSNTVVRDFSNHPPGVICTPPNPEKIATFEQAVAQLDELIGLGPVKEEVRKFANFVQISKQREEAGLKVASITYHMIFSGNPGTGKTTVARIMADIYRTLGIVKCGQLVECDRGGLIGEYVGQTAVKTSQVIDFALDGILFIDEAYAIVDEKGSGYGAECIATLLKRMEDDRDRLVVIVAGYTNEMKTFIDANPGLKSRISRQIDFPDYTPEELAAIFRMNAKKLNYELTPEADQRLMDVIHEATAKKDRQFGNARWARNLLDEAFVRQATRLSEIPQPTREQLMTLLPEDIVVR